MMMRGDVTTAVVSRMVHASRGLFAKTVIAGQTLVKAALAFPTRLCLRFEWRAVGWHQGPQNLSEISTMLSMAGP